MTLDEIITKLQQADSFVSTVEDLTGLELGLDGLRRDVATLTAEQAVQLAVTRFHGMDELRDADVVNRALRVPHRTSDIAPADEDAEQRAYANVESFVLYERLYSSSVYSLETSTTTLGRTLYPEGIVRQNLEVEKLVDDDDEWGDDTEVIRVRGRLILNRVPVALVREDLLGAAVTASNS